MRETKREKTMRYFKLDTINKKISIFIIAIILIALTSVSAVNYIIAKAEITRSNEIILKNVIESSLFEINKNYQSTLEGNGWMTQEEAQAASLRAIRQLHGELQGDSADAVSSATTENAYSQENEDAQSGATAEGADAVSGATTEDSASGENVDAVSAATANSHLKDHMLNLGEGGYFFIVNSDGDVIFHPFLDGNILDVETLDGRQVIQEMIQIAKSGGGILTYELGEEVSSISGKKTVYTQYFPHWDWSVAAVIYNDDLFRGSQIILNYNLIALAVILAVSLGLGILMTRRLTRPINMISGILEKVSRGDLTVGKINIKAKDETKVLADSVNLLTDKLNLIIKSMISSSNQLSQFSGELKEAADNVSCMTEEVTASITHMAQFGEEQTQNTVKSVEEVGLLGGDIERTAEAGSKIAQAAEKTMNLKEQGLDSVKELKRASDENDDNSRKMEEIINAINGHSEKIKEIVDIIAGVAEQTNLLALNANIEAARAGEAGRGFAVVAGEVRSLATETARATEGIREKVEEMLRQSEDAVHFVGKNRDGVANINKSVASTEDVFNEMAGELKNLLSDIHGIVGHNQETNKKKDHILGMLKSVTETAEENVSAMENISSAAEEQSMTVNEITGNISKLSEMSEELDSLINTFQTK